MQISGLIHWLSRRVGPMIILVEMPRCAPPILMKEARTKGDSYVSRSPKVLEEKAYQSISSCRSQFINWVMTSNNPRGWAVEVLEHVSASKLGIRCSFLVRRNKNEADNHIYLHCLQMPAYVKTSRYHIEAFEIPALLLEIVAKQNLWIGTRDREIGLITPTRARSTDHMWKVTRNARAANNQ